jgi:hypothetical protein
MNMRTPIPRRLRDHDARDRDPHGRLGEIIRSMKRPPPLSGDAQARILRRLRFSGVSKGERLASARRPALAVVVVLSVVLVGIGAHAGISRAFNAGLSWMRGTGSRLERVESIIDERGVSIPNRALHVGASAEIEPMAQSRVASPEPAAMPGAPVAPTESLNAPPPSLDTQAREARGVRRRVNARPTALSATADESPLAQESRLLARALDQLCVSHDDRAALATLAEYDARFPAGALRREAALARLDALTALGRTGDALQLLDTMDTTGPRSLEVLVLRGELRANAGRQQDALADFDGALSSHLGRSLRERALYGRASCRSRLGDENGANHDLDDYLLAFPEGPRAAEVRRKLNR